MQTPYQELEQQLRHEPVLNGDETGWRKDAAVRALATLFFGHTERLFAFIYHAGVEPTNNISERTIRIAVQWRKICFGNRSEAGEVATARLLTAAATCSINKRNLLHYLTEAVRCHRNGRSVPSLLPQTT